MPRGAIWFAALTVISGVLSTAHTTSAAVGDCGQPQAAGPVAADALEVLRTAVGTSDCSARDTCVCDVNSSGTVTASDALTVLRKAVGQNVTLVCPCGATTTVVATSTTTTTTSTMPVALGTKELRLLARSAGTYSKSDLPGTWELQLIAADPGSPYWGRGEIVVDSDGNFSGTLQGNNGGSAPLSGQLSISTVGIVSCPNGCDPDFAGALDSGKTLFVATSTNNHGAPQLFAITRKGTSYAQADLTGTWKLESLIAAQDSGRWNRGTLTIDASGAVSLDSVDSDGTLHTISETYKIDSSGMITCTGNCRPDFRATLDSGKTLIVATSTNADGSAKLNVVTKQANSYSQENLTGEWASSTLGAGDAPSWVRGTVDVAANGALSGTLADSDGSSTSASGTLSITGDGAITSSGDSRLRCSIDADKTVVACTDSR